MIRTGFFHAGYHLALQLREDASTLYDLISEFGPDDDIFEAAVMISATACKAGMKTIVPLKYDELARFINGMALAMDKKYEYIVS